jgi:hypothetical protein
MNKVLQEGLEWATDGLRLAKMAREWEQSRSVPRSALNDDGSRKIEQPTYKTSLASVYKRLGCEFFPPGIAKKLER